MVISDLSPERTTVQLAVCAGFLSLFLACLGLYGQLAYSVAQRRREIGIRMALGASHQNILSIVVRQGLELGLIGCVIGMSSSLLLARIVGSQLYGLGIFDPLTISGTTAMLLLVALLASWFPARGAASVDPIIALKME